MLIGVYASMQLSSSKQRPVITFLTDFGTSESYVGVMKGVVLNICADAQLVDVTHDIAPQQVAVAAWQLSTSYRYFPARTIHVCVVDPGAVSYTHLRAHETRHDLVC